jgi:hypothetical protein
MEKQTNELLPSPKSRRVNLLVDVLRTPDGKIDTQANVREHEKYERDHPTMIDMIGQIKQHAEQFGFPGLKEPIMFHEVPDPEFPDDKKRFKLQIVKGHRRAHALEFLASEEKNGKYVENVPAIVYPHLTERQFISMLLDHGDQLPLDKVEAYIAIKRALSFGRTHAEIATNYRPLLEKLSPLTDDQRKDMTRADGSLDPNKLRDRYRGTIQGFQRVFECPTVVETAVMEKLRGKTKWPTDKQVGELHSAHKEDQKEDPTVTPDRPGRRFTEKWEAIQAAVEKAREEGSNAPKSTAMKNRKTVDSMIASSRSILFKIQLLFITNDARVSEEGYKKAENKLVALESKFSETDLKELREILGVKPVATGTVLDKAPEQSAPPVEQSAQPVEQTGEQA